MSSNIKVAIRIRPLIQREINNDQGALWGVSEQKYVFQHSCRSTSYCFDRVFGTDEDNEVVYQNLCSTIVDSVMEGFNGTIFAYGQTSSGKTYTMDGKNGIIPSAISDIFSAIDNMPNREFLLRVSYLEIYNEIVSDLLNPEGKNLKVQETPNGVVSVIGLKEVEIKNVDEALQLMKTGKQSRHCGETDMNQKSSRSHAIFRMIVESRMCDSDLNDDVSVAQLNLVDLAGSENASQSGHHTGVRFKEGVHINQSLFTLSLVIQQLSERKRFVNYRDSSLTRILQNSLGGNANTVMLCTITPAALEQTLSTLKFAGRAKRIKNKPVANSVSSDQALLKRYTKQIKVLTDKLNEFQKPGEKESSKILKELQEKSQQNEDLKQQIETLKQKFIVSQFKTSPLPIITRTNRRETWCFGPSMGKNRDQKILEFRSIFKPLPVLQEENMSPLLSESKESSGVDLNCELTPRTSASPHLISVECQTLDTKSSGENKTENFKKLEMEFILLKSQNCSLKQELEELKEYTTLEKQLISESAIEALNKEKQELESQLLQLNSEEKMIQSMISVKSKVLTSDRDTQVNNLTPVKSIPSNKPFCPPDLNSGKKVEEKTCKNHKVVSTECGIQVNSFTPLKSLLSRKSCPTPNSDQPEQRNKRRVSFAEQSIQVNTLTPVKVLPKTELHSESNLETLQMLTDDFKTLTCDWKSIISSHQLVKKENKDELQSIIETLVDAMNTNKLHTERLSSLHGDHIAQLKVLNERSAQREKELQRSRLCEEHLKGILKKHREEFTKLGTEFLEFKKARKEERKLLLRCISTRESKFKEVDLLLKETDSKVMLAEKNVKLVKDYYKKKIADILEQCELLKNENLKLNEALKENEGKFSNRVMELQRERLQKLEEIISVTEKKEMESKNLLLSEHENELRKLKAEYELQLCKVQYSTVKLGDVKEAFLNWKECISNSKPQSVETSNYAEEILTLKITIEALEQQLLSSNGKVEQLEAKLAHQTKVHNNSDKGTMTDSTTTKSDMSSICNLGDNQLEETNRALENELDMFSEKVAQLEVEVNCYKAEIEELQKREKEYQASNTRCLVDKSIATDPPKESSPEQGQSLITRWENMVLNADSTWVDILAEGREKKADKKNPDVLALEKRIRELEEENKTHINKIFAYKSEVRQLQSNQECTIDPLPLKKSSTNDIAVPSAGSGIVEEVTMYEQQALLRQKEKEIKKLQAEVKKYKIYITRKKQLEMNKGHQSGSSTNKENLNL